MAPSSFLLSCPQMSPDSPKQEVIFTFVAKGPLLCAASDPLLSLAKVPHHNALWTPASCSLGPHRSSPKSTGACPPTTTPGWGWTLPFHLCVLLSLTPGLCWFTKTLITAAAMSLPGSATIFDLCAFYNLGFCSFVWLWCCSVTSNSLRPQGLQHTKFPCPSPSPRVCSNSCPLSQWSHSTISSSVFPFSSCLQSFKVSGSFPMSRPFTSGGQSIGASASVESFQWILRIDSL